MILTQSTERLLHEIRIKTLPGFFVSGKKKISTGWNQYTNQHFHVKGKIKEICCEYLKSQFENVPKVEYIEWVWTYGGKLRMDVDNKHSFWIKMSQDTLVRMGKIKDDTKECINWCCRGWDGGQPEDLIIQIYGR